MTTVAAIGAALCCLVGGLVHDPSGAPVTRANVELRGAATFHAQATVDGSFTLTVPPHDYQLSVAAPGYAPVAVAHVEVSDRTHLEVTLEPLDAGAPRTIGSVEVDGRLALARGEVPSQTIARADLGALGANRALDALALVPSATITRPVGGPRSAVTVVSLRGPDPSETLVALDGQILNNANTGDLDLSQFPVSPLAGVDVSDGLGPADNLGANTIGGEVNLRTLAPTHEPRSTFTLSYGSFDTSELAGQATGERGRLGYAFSVQSAQSAGYVHDFPAQFSLADGSRFATALGSSIFAQSALATLAWRFSERADVRIRAFTLADRRDQSAAEDAPVDLSQDHPYGSFVGPGDAFVTQGIRALMLSGRAPLGAGTVLASYALSGETTTFAGGLSSSPYDVFSNDKLSTLSLAWERATPTFTLRVGGYTRGESLDEGVAFGADVQRVRSQALTLQATASVGPRVQLAASGFETHYSTFGSSLDGRVGATVDLDARSVLRASVGTGFRPPLLAERYAVPLSVLEAGLPGSVDANCVAANGNPDLRPEHVTAYELGYGRRVATTTTVDLSLYRTNLRDPIENAYPLAARCPSEGVDVVGQVIPINAGRVVYQGGALRVTREVGAFLLRAAYGLNVAYPFDLPATVANPTSGANLVDHQQFQGIPIQTGALGLRWRRGPLHLDVQTTYRGRNNELSDGPFATLDGAFGFRRGRVDYALAFRNLTSAEAGRFTRLGLGLPYPSSLVPSGRIPTDRLSLEPASFSLIVTVR